MSATAPAPRVAIDATTHTEVDPTTYTLLPVPRYGQLQNQWCWAACTQMAATYYGNHPAQCSLANYALTRTDCCPAAPVCNVTIGGAAIPALYSYAGVANCSYVPGQIAYIYVQSSINNNQIIEVGLQWTGGHGHLVLIVGWTTTNGFWVYMNDPAAGQSCVAYTALQAGFGWGTWAESWVVWS